MLTTEERELLIKFDSLFKHNANQLSEIYARISRLESNVRDLVNYHDDVDDRLSTIEYTLCHNKMHMVEPENTNKKLKERTKESHERIKELQVKAKEKEA